MVTDSTITLNFAYRGTTLPLIVSDDTSLAHLQAELVELTAIPVPLQKLLYKGKNIASYDRSKDTLVSSLGLRSGAKLQLLGTTSAELKGLLSTEEEQLRIERIVRERALRGSTYKVCPLSPPYYLVLSNAGPLQWDEFIVYSIISLPSTCSVTPPSETRGRAGSLEALVGGPSNPACIAAAQVYRGHSNRARAT